MPSSITAEASSDDVEGAEHIEGKEDKRRAEEERDQQGSVGSTQGLL
eukprot:CAMPEP_0168483422 /NCGR_PEP_ID=MMETSP0228-20121227/65563_1 /TAXON_ID=133427 /ORGANISM="Protoceratium reticulatum, Strain CCCM 535 (=CCMP 1889)" /LENGTH=46 /DNA_ID= /DNA_START= /DNA_END= /DNA_ORIENTATION=